MATPHATDLEVGEMQGRRLAGDSFSDISKATRFSTQAVRYWCAGNGRVPQAHRPPRVCPGQRAEMRRRRQMLLRLAAKKDRRGVRLNGSVREICGALAKKGVKVCRQTVDRDLIASGWKCRVRPRVPSTSAEDAEKRVVFAIKFANVNTQRLIFSDEKLWTTNDNGIRTEWNPDGATPSRRGHARFPRGRVMVWGAIGHNFRHLIFFPRGSVTARAYIDLCLKGIVIEHIRSHPRIIFQQDGARVHTCNETTNYLASNGIKRGRLMEPWPPRSPTLNPIENLWGVLSRRVSRHAAQDQAELIAAITTEWANLTDDEVNAFVASFTSAAQRTVANNGVV